MLNAIQELYEVGLEKCAGDHDQAVEFVEGFIKEASGAPYVASGLSSLLQNKALQEGALKVIGGGAAGLLVGLGIHGVTSSIRGVSDVNQRAKFEEALKQAVESNQLLRNADRAKLLSYADTMFKFAPHVAADPNLLANVLSSAIHGESMDMTTVRTLADLESRYQETRKNGIFTPKTYI